MYRKFLHFLQGDVRLKIESPTPERVLNLCAAHAIPFWDVQYLDEATLLLCTNRHGAGQLRRVTREIRVQITALGESGAPRMVQTFRRRYVLLAAAALFFALVWCGHTYIWGFEVTGNDTVPTEDILHALEDYGITLGTRTQGIDQRDMRNHVLLALPDVSWMAVNVKGCTAHVQVVERHRPPRRMLDAEKTNVVAAKAGLVTKVQALDGEKRVLPGDTVTKGQLLISGAVDDPDQTGTRLLHAQGGVWARTWYELSVKIPLSVEEKGTASRVTAAFSVNFGKRHIKIGGKGSMLGSNCDKIRTVKEIFLPGGLRLPISLCREKTRVYETKVRQRSREEALQEGKKALLRELNGRLSEDASVESTRFSASDQGTYLLVSLSAECVEQIGVEVPIT